jgi:hypothetical protein
VKGWCARCKGSVRPETVSKISVVAVDQYDFSDLGRAEKLDYERARNRFRTVDQPGHYLAGSTAIGTGGWGDL